jgi:uncharacterized membrane protein YfcA
MTLAGGLIGALSAVVGIGGGSMTVPLLVWRGVAPVKAVGSSSACGIAIGLASAAGYALHAPGGALPAHAVGYVYLPAAIGWRWPRCWRHRGAPGWRTGSAAAR